MQLTREYLHLGFAGKGRSLLGFGAPAGLAGNFSSQKLVTPKTMLNVQPRLINPATLVLLSVCVLASLPAAAQENQPNNKAFIWANGVNLGTSFLNASAEHYGARQCLNEGDNRPRVELRGKAQHSLMIALPVDVAIGFASWKLRRKHPGLAVWLPATSAGMQTGFATLQYTQGCF